MNRRYIQLDVSKIPRSTPVIRLGQKDVDGLILTVQVLDHGEPMDISDYDVSLLIKFSESEMYEFLGEVSGNTAEFVVDSNGMHKGYTDNACVSIDGGDFVLSTERFRVQVLESAERS